MLRVTVAVAQRLDAWISVPSIRNRSRPSDTDPWRAADRLHAQTICLQQQSSRSTCNAEPAPFVDRRCRDSAYSAFEVEKDSMETAGGAGGHSVGDSSPLCDLDIVSISLYRVIC